MEFRNQTVHSLLGIFVFGILLFFAAYFYLERTVILDASFQLFSILRTDEFAIQVFRFGAFVTQMFPLIGSKFGLELENLARLYSMSFVIFPIVVYLLLSYKFKLQNLAIGLLLFVVLMPRYTFYWVQSELIQGMVYVFLYIGMAEKYLSSTEKETYKIAIIYLLLFVIAFCHPLLLFAIIYYWLYKYLDSRNTFQPLKGQYLFFFLLLLIKNQLFKNWYDSQASGNLKNFVTWFPKYWNMPSIAKFYGYLIHDYWMFVIFCAVLLAFLLNKRLKEKLVLCILFLVGYSFLINVSYANGADQFYIESMYLLLSFFIILPFTFDVLPSLNKWKWLPIASVLFFTLCLTQIYSKHKVFSARVAWNSNILDKINNKKLGKVFINKAEIPLEIMLMDWGITYENWLLSEIKYGKTIVVSVEENPGELEWAISKNKSFVSKWGVWDFSSFSKKQYFNFNDTLNYSRMDKLN